MANEKLKQVKARQQQKHDTELNWNKAGDNGFIPLAGEIIVYDADLEAEIPESRIKVGDDKTNINDLPFVSGGVGKNTKEGGIIFNDYEHNQALAENTIAMGTNSRAGCCGYHFLSTKILGNGQWEIYVDDADFEEFNKAENQYRQGSQKEWTICFDGKEHWYSELIIRGVRKSEDGSSVIVVEFKDGNTTKTLTHDGSIDNVENWIYVPECPNAGIPVAVSHNAWAAGEQAVAIGRSAKAFGRDAKAIGNYGTALGRATKAGYAAMAEGYGTQALGQYSHAEGINSVAKGTVSHAEGGGSNALGDYSHSEGYSTVASGECSHAEGYQTNAIEKHAHSEGHTTEASAWGAHAEGIGSKSIGSASHAEGNATYAKDTGSHSEGIMTDARNKASHAEGYQTIANGDYSHAEGDKTTTSGIGSHAEGFTTTASGDYSHAEGYQTAATVKHAHAEGYITEAGGWAAHAEGLETKAIGNVSHAEGHTANASGVASHAEGYKTVASETGSHAEGNETQATGSYAHAEGNITIASGTNTHAEGYQTTATHNAAHAEGYGTKSLKEYAHSEGLFTEASGVASHAEGKVVKALGESAHAEGEYTIANGQGSHAEGFESDSFGEYSHAEGNNTNAEGANSHAEGYLTIASNKHAHAEGWSNTASGVASHAEGIGNTAAHQGSSVHGFHNNSARDYQHVVGEWNAEDADALFIVGNGANDNNRSNAFVVNKDGTISINNGSKLGESSSNPGYYYSLIKENTFELKLVYDNDKLAVYVDNILQGTINNTKSGNTYTGRSRLDLRINNPGSNFKVSNIKVLTKDKTFNLNDTSKINLYGVELINDEFKFSSPLHSYGFDIWQYSDTDGQNIFSASTEMRQLVQTINMTSLKGEYFITFEDAEKQWYCQTEIYVGDDGFLKLCVNYLNAQNNITNKSESINLARTETEKAIWLNDPNGYYTDPTRVSYKEEQSLTNKEQEQARINIGAASLEYVKNSLAIIKEDIPRPIVTSAEGDATLTLKDSAPFPAQGLKVNVKAAQDGTGDPSPTNIRPITNQASVQCHALDNNAIPVFSVNATLPENSGFGYVDYMRKKYVQTHEAVAFTGTEAFSAWAKTGTFRVVWKKCYNETSYSAKFNGCCSHYKQSTHGDVYNAKVDNAVCALVAGGGWLAIADKRFETVDDFKAYLAEQYAAGTPVTVIYKLATPIEHDIEIVGDEVRTVYPSTIIGHNGESVEISYVADIKNYIDKKFAELAATIINNT